MSFWQADCSKLRNYNLQSDGDSMQADASLWSAPTQHCAAGCMHEEDSSVAVDGRMCCNMHQQSIGGTVSLDDSVEQSAACSVLQQLRLPAEDLLLPQLSQLAPFSAANSVQQLSVQCSYDDSTYVVEQQVRMCECTHACMHARMSAPLLAYMLLV
jgi:hypothetical protein